jgi:PAS domain S-box-containing protein
MRGVSGLERELDELGGDVTTALEELPVPAVLLDPDGIVRWQNAAARAARGDVVGSSFTEFVAPDELPRAEEAFTNILCRGDPAEFTLHVSTADGTYAPVEISSAPVRGGQSVVGVFGLVQPAAPPSRAGAGHDDLLTPRQLEVLRLLAQGASTHEIAAMLHLATTTVRNHVANILSALGAHTRLQAVVAARQRGLLDD